MQTQSRHLDNMEPMRIMEEDVLPLETGQVRNDRKHKATCLKNKLKRKSKKR